MTPLLLLLWIKLHPGGFLPPAVHPVPSLFPLNNMDFLVLSEPCCCWALSPSLCCFSPFVPCGFHLIAFIWDSLYKHFDVYGLHLLLNFVGNWVCKVFVNFFYLPCCFWMFSRKRMGNANYCSNVYAHTQGLELSWFLSLFLNLHLRICLLILEREEVGGGKREKYRCERETSISCLPYAPLLGIFWGTRWCSNRLSHRPGLDSSPSLTSNIKCIIKSCQCYI